MNSWWDRGVLKIRVRLWGGGVAWGALGRLAASCGGRRKSAARCASGDGLCLHAIADLSYKRPRWSHPFRPDSHNNTGTTLGATRFLD